MIEREKEEEAVAVPTEEKDPERKTKPSKALIALETTGKGEEHMTEKGTGAGAVVHTREGRGLEKESMILTGLNEGIETKEIIGTGVEAPEEDKKKYM